MNEIKLNNKKFKIEDTLEYITLADSFLKNKVGSGHGEAKLYVGNINDRLMSFFNNFENMKCFFCKKDFLAFLHDAEDEFKNPQQEYSRKDDMPNIFNKANNTLNSFVDNILYFDLYRVDVIPPRVYINSNSEYYKFMRVIGLPNISYLSVLKLSDEMNNCYFYFKIFIDYKPDVEGYIMPEENRQITDINGRYIASDDKKRLIQSRIGQGEYRLGVLAECPFCPFTLVNDERLLIASHIKPWRSSNDIEKLDPKNGFMFTPTYDRLFDQGFISFEENKKLVVSPWLSPMNQKRLGIYTGKNIAQLPLDEQRMEYIKYHRKYIFKD